MPRSYRLFFAALVGWLILAGNHPEATKPNADSYQRIDNALSYISATLERQEKRDASSPDKEPCKGIPEDHKSELCAQWQAANWAKYAVYVASVSLLLSIVGIGALIYTLRQTDKTLRIAQKERATATRRALASDQDTRSTLRVMARSADASLEMVEEMRAGNNLADRHTKKQLRAYVLPAGGDFKIGENGEIEAKLIIRNFGQTPALEVKTWIHLWIADYPLNEDLPRPDDDFITSVGVVGPGNHSEFHNSRPRINEHSLRKIENGTAALYLYGEIKYADIFGDPHTTRYVYFTNGDVGWGRGRFSQYISGNSIA